MLPLGEELLGDVLEPPLLGEALEPPLPDELELAPPEAVPEPDLAGSVALEEPEPEPGVAVEPVGAGVLEAPPEGDVPDEEVAPEPELDGGVDGDVALPLELPLVLPVPVVPLSWPQAARPKAMATAIANVESFICPPWLDKEKAARNGPGLSP